jgi:hypothetical protein
VEPLPPARGERGASVDSRFGSRARLSPKLPWEGRGGGWTDCALASLALLARNPDVLSTDDRNTSLDAASPARLGRLLALLAMASLGSATAPGPMDLRGGFEVLAIVFETGG